MGRPLGRLVVAVVGADVTTVVGSGVWTVAAATGNNGDVTDVGINTGGIMTGRGGPKLSRDPGIGFEGVGAPAVTTGAGEGANAVVFFLFMAISALKDDISKAGVVVTASSLSSVISLVRISWLLIPFGLTVELMAPDPGAFTVRVSREGDLSTSAGLILADFFLM